MDHEDASPEVRFVLADPQAQPVRRAVERYFTELASRFEGGFDPSLYAGGRVADGDEQQACVLGSRAGEPVACGALVPIGPGIAELKRMWVEPGLRGQGVGRRLLAALEALARARRFHTVRLDTNSALTQAIAMYERSGYQRIARYNDNPYAQVWFEKHLD